MKIVTLVPSWTETFLELGLEVVGRTRFCIHPQGIVESIPVVGGTKDVNWDLVANLEPDLLVVDKEENRKEAEQKSPCPLFVTHVEQLSDVAESLMSLCQLYRGKGLEKSAHRIEGMQKRWEAVSQSKPNLDLQKDSPGIEWIVRPPKAVSRIIYVIWKNPWMAVGQNTFIGSLLTHLYKDVEVPLFKKKYPSLELENFNDGQTLFLFSSEPFPFKDHVETIRAMGLPCGLVEGESYSWFGARSLKFLENVTP